MKPNPQITPAAADWSRAKGLLADLKSAVRRSLSAQVLLGKELSCIKKRLGFVLGRNQWVPQIAGPSKSWGEWCKFELGISDDTADRWIRCFEAALKRAKARKAREPQACRLLEIPADELTGDELEALAEIVAGLVDGETQAGLLEELGIVKRSKETTGGATAKAEKNAAEECYHQFVGDLFSRITGGCGELEKRIFSIQSKVDYRLILEDLPIEDEAGKPSLMNIKRSLDDVFHGRLAEVLKDVEEAIQRKMPGVESGRSRKKTATARIQ